MQQHTESSRQMRGAWKAGGEYIPELHTEGRAERLVGCDGFGARYRARVFRKRIPPLEPDPEYLQRLAV